MKNHDKYPWHRKGFSKGILNAKDPETISRQGDQSYHDAENLTLSKGSPGRLERIGGETLLYPASGQVVNNSDTGNAVLNNGHYYSDLVFNTGVWDCVGSIVTVIDGVEEIVEFWGDKGDVGLDSFIRVNGVIYAQNPYIGFGAGLDLDENGDGVVFCTDGVLRPMFFDVRDLIDKSGTEYYYSNFSPQSNFVIASSPNDYPVFLGLVLSGSEVVDYEFTGDLPLQNGQYSYSIQYGTTSGEYSPWSHSTPLIPVIQKNSGLSEKYPERGIYSADPGTESSYGVKLIFRINNVANYDFIRIKRTEYIGGLPLGYTPASSIIIGIININDQEISTATVVDFGGDEESISITEDVGNTIVVDNAKALQYYNSRLWLLDVTTPQLELSDDIIKLYSDGESIRPVLKDIGSVGFSDPKTHCYDAGYMSGERYGYALIGFDSSYVGSFAVQVNTENAGYKFPNRRDVMTANDQLVAIDDIPEAARIDGSVGKCFERFDNNDDIAISGVLELESGDDEHSIHPTSIDDDDNNDGRTISGVYTNTNIFTNQPDGYIPFAPRGYAQRKFTCGAALKGINRDLLPGWVSSIGVARTAPAKRVLFQGIGIYDFYYDGEQPKKYTNKIIFFSSDMSTNKGLLSSSDLLFIKNNCKIQLVSPVGYFPDIFNGGGYVAYGSSHMVADLLLNAVILRDSNGTINAPDPSMGINQHVGFGVYRNKETILNGGGDNFDFKEDSIIGNISDSDGIIDIVNIRHCTDIAEKSEWYGRGEWWEIELSKNIYYSTDVPTGYPYDFPEAKAFHEPFYMINIINDSASIPTGDSVSYINTGVFIKLDSVMHNVTVQQADIATDNLSIQLVDERYEDCFTLDDGGWISRGKLYENRDDGSVLMWMSDSLFGAGTLTSIRNQIKNIGYAVIGGENVYGLYKQRIDNGIYYVDFNALDADNKYYKPKSLSKIICKYSSERPIIAFGGDTYVNDSIFAAIDLNKPEGEAYLPFNFPLMYNWYSLSTSLPWADQFWGVEKPLFYDTPVNELRQLLIRFISENRFNNCFDYEVSDPLTVSNDRFFPKINYIPHPNPANTDDEMDTIWSDETSTQYKTDFPEENTIWRYGGFRFLPVSNQDFLHKLNTNVYTQPPQTISIINKKTKRIMFSSRTSQDFPFGFRSFIQSNYYDLNYDGGAIICSEKTEDDSGGSLYVFTDHGVVILIIDKRQISSLQGDPDNMILSDESTIVTGEYWVSKLFGLSDAYRNTVRSVGDGIIFANNNDLYYVSGGKLAPISGTYYDKIKAWLNQSGYSYESVYDIKNRRYWLSALHPDRRTMNFVFDIDTKNWIGSYTNSFSKLVSTKDYVVGSHSRPRDGKVFTYRLNMPSSTNIGLETINSKLVSTFIPYTEYPASDIVGRDAIKEFRKLRLSSDRVPTSVRFYKSVDDYEAGDYFSEISGADFKNFVNFESWISAGKQNPSDSVVVEVLDSELSDIWIDFMSVQFKKK